VGRTNIKPPMRTSSKFRKPYINSQDYPDYMRIVPAKYVYMSNPDYPHSLYKKPYAEYSEDYPAMELTWNQDPIVFDWRPDWDWDDYQLPDSDVTPTGLYTCFTISPNNLYSVTHSDYGFLNAWDSSTGEDIADCANPEQGTIYIGFSIYYTDYCYISRGFMMYDLSYYKGTVDSAVFNFHTPELPGLDYVSIQQGEQGDNIDFGDYMAFSGLPFGITGVQPGDNEIILNKHGISYINSCMGGKAYLVLREYVFDYNYIDPNLVGSYLAGVTCYPSFTICGEIRYYGPEG